MKKIMTILFLITILLIAGCAPAKKSNSTTNKLGVAVAIPPQKTFVKAVGGDLVNVVTMIPPGNSPGNYAPSPKKLTKFSSAKIYFSIGAPTEKANILTKANQINQDLKIVKLDQKVAQVYPDREFSAGKRDPHIWLSPKRVQVIIDVIAKQLSTLDPEHKEQYQQNAKEYLTKLKKVDQELENILNKLEKKTFIVYHPSLGYFAKDYNLQMVAIEESGKEATPKRMKQIIDQAKKENIKVIFHQAQIDSQQSEAIAEEIQGKTIKVNPLATNYLDNLRKMAKTFKSVLN